MTAKIDRIRKLGDRCISICVECCEQNYVEIFLDINMIEYNYKRYDKNRNLDMDVIDGIFNLDTETAYEMSIL